jgi:hypothetical protein
MCSSAISALTGRGVHVGGVASERKDVISVLLVVLVYPHTEEPRRR